ncbi:MAG: HD domain-containing protein [Chloroflexi bacterium]|nr:HD domain-containing protein [Chloroflexota bacterium]
MSSTSDTRIADVEAGRPVEGVFAVARKQRRHDKNGDPYLVLELTDSTGSIEGRIWKNADWFDRNVREGDRARVVGRGSRYRDQVQLDIRRMDRVAEDDDAAAPLESFVPSGRRPLEDLAGELDFLVGEITHPQLRSLVEAVWGGAERAALLRSPATANDHHAYLGGLVEHTVSVAAICMTAEERHSGLNRDLLLAAALLHDVGRVRELRSETVLEADAEAGLVGHVLLGHELLLEAATRVGGDLTVQSWWPKLVHAITMHHGPVERCRTREAVVLASANALDARLAARDR